MNRKPLRLWLALLLALFMLAVKAAMIEESDTSDNDDDVASLDSTDDLHPSSPLANTPDGIFLRIITGHLKHMPVGILPKLSNDQISYLLRDRRGAEVLPARAEEFFKKNLSFLTDEIDGNAPVFHLIRPRFFKLLPIFNADYSGDMSAIPNIFLYRTIEVKNARGYLNLDGFIKKIEEIDQWAQFEVPRSFTLPHLFDFTIMVNPTFFMGRGLAFNPGSINPADIPDKDLVAWTISMQLFIHQILNTPEYRNCNHYKDIKPIVCNELKAAHTALKTNSILKYNYFDLPTNREFSKTLIFGKKTPSKLPKQMTMKVLGEWLGFDDFENVRYDKLRTESRIIYRLAVYVAIFNPHICSPEDLNDYIITIVCSGHSFELTDSEIKFLVDQCFKRKLAVAIAGIFRLSEHSRFRVLMEPLIGSQKETFDTFIELLDDVSDRLVLYKRWPRVLNHGIRITDEESFKNSQSDRCKEKNMQTEIAVEEEEEDLEADYRLRRTKRLRNHQPVPETEFQSHFLTIEEIRQFGNVNNNYSEDTIILPYPNREYLNEVYDHMMAHLTDPNLGVLDRKAEFDKIPKNEDEKARKIREQRKADDDKNEKELDEFVREAFYALYSCYKNPSAYIYIEFDDNSGLGIGPKKEAFSMLSMALLLPRYKIFSYNHDLKAFVPYPLLHPDIMGSLGYLAGYFIFNNDTLSWKMPPEYFKFLFYEEDPLDPMQNVIDKIYSPLFKYLEGLNTPNMNPLDYFSTVFHTHQPLAFSAKQKPKKLDLFNPSSATHPEFNSLVDFMDEEDLELLDRIIEFPKYPDFGESKDEPKDLIEAKEEDDDYDNDYAMDCDKERALAAYKEKYAEAVEALKLQTELKEQIVQVMKAAASEQIISILLKGRFLFIRAFMPFFNTFSRSRINADFFDQIQKAHEVEITAERLIEGLVYPDEKEHIQVKYVGGPGEENEYLTPAETLERILRSYDPFLLKRFHWFCTGLTSLPLGGLKRNPIRVEVSDIDLMPTASTCIRTIYFYVRSDYAANLETVTKAITWTEGYQYIEDGVQRPGNTTGNAQNAGQATAAAAAEDANVAIEMDQS